MARALCDASCCGGTHRLRYSYTRLPLLNYGCVVGSGTVVSTSYFSLINVSLIDFHQYFGFSAILTSALLDSIFQASSLQILTKKLSPS